ncbi:MAG: (Fe-S)-binding protein [Desulfobulbaceae bacterium]|jgi:glycolate oxidase iron-sulfur subunit|nr:(Fe-S)-binding protein [Desulfobulbaceae bacterium]
MAGISKLKTKCAKCGSCGQVCPVFKETGRESDCARGKLHLFQRDADLSLDYFNTLLAKCIQCGGCDDICPRNLQPSLIIREWRGRQSVGKTQKGYSSYLARHILNSPPLLSASSLSLSLLEKLPSASGLRQKIDFIPPHHNSPIATPRSDATTTLLYYPGCLARHLQTDISDATRYLASLCGYTLSIPAKASCCGLASSCSGKQGEAQSQALRNIQAYSTTTGPILTSCGSCYAQLISYPQLFEPHSPDHQSAVAFADRVQEFSTFFLGENKLESHQPPQTVYYHDPCHLRFGRQPIIKEPRQLIRNLNGQDVVNRDTPLGCCGQGGLFALVHPDLAQAIFKKAGQQVVSTAAATVVTSCSSCLMGWQLGTQHTEITAEHISVFLAKRCENC